MARVVGPRARWVIAVLAAAGMACASSRIRETPSPQPAASAANWTPILQGLDHFFATSAKPESLYRFFRDTLGWPEVFPFRDYGDFASGVVSVGNTMFEVVTWAVPAGEHLPTELKGLAFEPSARLPVTLARLAESLGAPHKPDSVMMTNQAGVRALAYVNIGLDGPGGLPPSTASIFINDNLGSPGAAKRRSDGAIELSRRGGGGLGIIAIEELVIGVADPGAALARWRAVAGPGGG